jgi:hypothetical protein
MEISWTDHVRNEEVLLKSQGKGKGKVTLLQTRYDPEGG